jgi:transposase
MEFRIRLTRSSRQSLTARLQQAYRSGELRVIKRIHALLGIMSGQSPTEVAELLHLSEPTVRAYVVAFLRQGLDSLHYRRPAGRPAKLTQTQRRELATLLRAGPEAAGYATGCWTTLLIQDLILRHFGVTYHPHYVSELLDRLGFSFQKARFVADHLDAAGRSAWQQHTWPEIERLAHQQEALLLFGDEASFGQWGSLSYTWAPKGEQPTVKTSGRRKAYKVFSLIDYCSGRLFWYGLTGRFDSTTYAAFLTTVLAQTHQPIILIQDGARYHTSRAMQAFFAAHAERLQVFQLPAYSRDLNPIEGLWKKVRKQATHLKYFANFEQLLAAVEGTLTSFAELPNEILALMGHYTHARDAELAA